MGLYLKLFHGRTSPDEELDDWGVDGPVFGPLSYVHTTYTNHLKLGGCQGDSIGDLFVQDDMVFYGGIWYGDWSVFEARSSEGLDRHQLFVAEKAKLPNTRKVGEWTEHPTESGYRLTKQQGKAVQEILRRYVGEELAPQLELVDGLAALDDECRAVVQKDIAYIEGLARLFGE